MNGFELLEKVKKHYPNVIRMALSGYSDRSDVITAIEKNLAKIYLYKPWDNKELRYIISSIFELEDTLQNEGLFELFNNLESLPTVPKLYKKINEMLENNESIENIRLEIEKDQSLASRILKVANSAFYAAKTGSIKQAILYIGLINVKNIVVSNTIFNNLDIADAEKNQLRLIDENGPTISLRDLPYSVPAGKE
jgi:response regulator RpfG family c-di-GMP phosphodiesterase